MRFVWIFVAPALNGNVGKNSAEMMIYRIGRVYEICFGL